MCVFQSGWSVHSELQSGFNSQTTGQKHRGNAGRVSAVQSHLQGALGPICDI